ncbi:MAG TPA: hypothetical protein VED40_07975 [Azospirillaceae bacterium]|jgi:hypothetical protein|nr:hypothetical protein [Azospirillaceae bacterium]
MAEHDTSGQSADFPSDEALGRWITALVDYAQDWDRTFENRPDYFTQEYWYLFVGCLTARWRGAPLTVSAACQVMKSGSNRTREDRIKRAVMDGYLMKEKADEDGRTAYVVPTPKLEAVMRDHLARTLLGTRAAIG